MNNETNKPVATIRDGSLKATIWGNPTDDGRTRYSISLTRSYTDAEGKWHDTSFVNRGELLRFARLAEKAYDALADLYAGQAQSGADVGEGQ